MEEGTDFPQLILFRLSGKETTVPYRPDYTLGGSLLH